MALDLVKAKAQRNEFIKMFAPSKLRSLNGQQLLNSVFSNLSNSKTMADMVSTQTNDWVKVNSGTQAHWLLYYNKGTGKYKTQGWKTQKLQKGNTVISEQDAIAVAEEIKKDLLKFTDYIDGQISLSPLDYDQLFNELDKISDNNTYVKIWNSRYMKYLTLNYPEIFPLFYNNEWHNGIMRHYLNIKGNLDKMSTGTKLAAIAKDRASKGKNTLDGSIEYANEIIKIAEQNGWAPTIKVSKSNSVDQANNGNKQSNSTNHAPIKKYKHKLNQILYGPPGTGKTYHTIIYAVAICEGKAIEEVEKEDYSGVLERYTSDYKDQIEFVTFHQSYGYEEFIQGIKPSTDKGNVVYNVEDGIFKKFCDKAAQPQNKNKKYVFIIDEINRGNVSKIFGELITLIEDSKRIGVDESGKAKGMKATLPYEKVDEKGNKVKVEFGVPENVYILGTMNTADRSLVQLDAAFRRRFRFKEMMPKYDNLRTKVNGIDLAELLKQINKRISVRMDREHQIGHSYFLKVISFEELKETFRYEIIPLLQEYFYDDYANIKDILNDSDDKFISVEEYNKTKLYEITDSDTWLEDDFKKIYE